MKGCRTTNEGPSGSIIICGTADYGNWVPIMGCRTGDWGFLRPKHIFRITPESTPIWANNLIFDWMHTKKAPVGWSLPFLLYLIWTPQFNVTFFKWKLIPVTCRSYHTWLGLLYSLIQPRKSAPPPPEPRKAAEVMEFNHASGQVAHACFSSP